MPIEQLMWVEKYRPWTLDEVADQKEIKQRLKLLVEKKGELPHMLFAGPPGSGKTTTALIIARQLLGDGWKDYTLSLNASVAPGTPVMIRIGGEVRLVDFQWLAKRYFTAESTKYAYPTDLEVLSLDKAGLEPGFRPVANISRHKVQFLAEIDYNGGSVSTTLDHSVMVLNDEGEIVEKAVSDLKRGSLLVTFRAEIKSDSIEIPAPEFQVGIRSGIPEDPATGLPLKRVPLNAESSWILGSYLAEGCVSLPVGGGGKTILTYRYPEESSYAERAAAYFRGTMGLHARAHTIVSGSSGRRSGVQLTVCSKKLARFLANHFYSESAPKHLAGFKRVPDFIYGAPIELRKEFLKGYMGDATGNWEEIVRYSSKSELCLVGTSWLGRVTGLHTSIYERECRVTWDLPRFSYFIGDLIDARPFIRFFEQLGKKAGFNWRYELRHQLYSKKSKTISKTFIANLLKRLNPARLSPSQGATFEKLTKLASSCLYTTHITDIKVKPYGGYVYDVAVPGSQTFWGGTSPILLHNSDERGIDIVRERVKTFARFSDRREGIPFRLVILDECDEMCLDPETRVAVGPLERLKESSLCELYQTHGERFFQIPTFNPRTRRLENDQGKIVPSGTADLYRITFEDGRVVLASADHPFFVINANSERVVRTKELVAGTELADFSNKLLRCYDCKGIFYRHYASEAYERHFCSLECRNKFFGSMSSSRSTEEKRTIAFKAQDSQRRLGVHQRPEYRRKRAGIAKALVAQGRIPDPRSWKKFRKGEGAWLGKRLSQEHKDKIGVGDKLFFREPPEIRERITARLKVALRKEDGAYRKLVREGFFKETSRKAYLASVRYWKENGFRSKTEMKMAELLNRWHIPFERERLVFRNDSGRRYPFAVDFVVGKNTAVLVNGCWWHVCPDCGVEPRYEKQRRNMLKDLRHYAELEKLGYKLVIVWEHELRDDETIKQEVLPKIYQTVGVSGGALPRVKHSRVSSLEYAGRCEVLNISVVNNQNFLLANGILTHNTNDAQTALRRIMEETSAHTRFILVCNYSSGIIEPLQSRCVIFRFQRLDEAALVAHIKDIASKEKVKVVGAGTLGAVFEATQGDLRQAINLVQAASVSGELTAESVAAVTGTSVKARVAEIIAKAMDGDFSGARSKMVELTRVYGVPERDFLRFANESLASSGSDSVAKAISILAEYDFRLVQGAQPELQLTAMLAQLAALKGKGE